jgi:hypothetical protein
MTQATKGSSRKEVSYKRPVYTEGRDTRARSADTLGAEARMVLTLALLILALLAAEIWVLFTQRSRIAISVASVALVGWVALFGFSSVWQPDRYAWAIPRYYSVGVEGQGPHTVHLHPIQELPGFVVVPVE